MTPRKKPVLQTIKCAFCSKKVRLPKIRTRKYCSKECRDSNASVIKRKQRHSKYGRKRLCQVCGRTAAPGGRRRTCSKKCFDTAVARQNAPKTCHLCGKVITNPRGHKYCTIECRLKHRSLTAWMGRRKKHPETMRCRECGAEMTEAKQIKYCSSECRTRRAKTDYESKLKAAIKECKRCGKVLVNRLQTYCSDDCRIMFNALKQKKRVTALKRRARDEMKGQSYLDAYHKKIEQDAREKELAMTG